MPIPKISYTEDAFTSLLKHVNFIESKNTRGAGLRWLSRYESFLRRSLQNPASVKKCNNKTLYDLHLHCLNFNDWLIAFSLQGKTVLIEALLHKSRVID